MIKHTKVSTKVDSGDTSLIRPSDWNADHEVSGLTPTEFASPNVSQWTNDAGYITSAAIPAHNALSGLQGGTTNEYYHLTSAKYTVVQNTSGTNTGDQTITLTNDVTGSGTGSFAATLATVNSNVGSFGSATQVPTYTVNGKGLITAASNTSIQIAESQVTNLTTDLAAKQTTTLTSAHILVGNGSNVAASVAMSGDATIDNTGAVTVAHAPASGITGILASSHGGTGVNSIEPYFDARQFGTCILWLDAADPNANGTGMAPGSLASWVDKSGSGYTATASGSGEPSYGSVTQNNLAVVTFNGSTNYMSIPSFAVGSNLTVIVAAKSSNNSLIIEQSVNPNQNDGFHVFGNSGGIGSALVVRNGGVVVNVAGSNWLGTNPVVGAATYNGSNLFGYVNNVTTLSNSGSITNTTVTDTLYIGARAGTSLFMTGDIYEIIIYSGVVPLDYLQYISTALQYKWQTGSLPLSWGGLGANLTASNGGIIYSTASAGAILAGTSTAAQMLQSGSSATPAWSTATWPATTTASQLLYSSSTNTVAGLATANTGVLTTNGSGVPSITSQSALTVSNDTNVTLTTGGSASTALLNAASITAGWTGTLAASRGGTGQSSLQPWFDPRWYGTCQLWLDSCDPANTGALSASGTAYGTWSDKSSNAFSATQATGAKQPLLELATQNRLPAMQFTGASSQNLSITDNANLAWTSGFTAFVVAKLSATGSQVVMNKRNGGGTTAWQFSLITGGGASSGMQYCDSTTCYYSNTTINTGTTSVYTWDMTSTTGTMYTDSSTANFTSSADFRPTSVSANANIGSDRGSANFLSGDIMEIIVFSPPLSATARLYVQAALKSKWGTA